MLFLVDYAARPVVTDREIYSLSLRYFELGDDERLREYVDELARD